MQKKNVRSKKYSRHIKSKNKKQAAKPTHQQKLEGWEKNLSFTENLNRLGINNRDVNEKITEAVKGKKVDLPQIEVEEISVDMLKLLTQQRLDPDKARNKIKLSQDDEWAVQDLYKKYKDDFTKWEKDHKLNPQQWTRIQSKKKFDGYMKRHGKCPKDNISQ